MPLQPSEQLLHDRVNLDRLLRRLEKTTASPEWEAETRQPERAAWIKTKGMLQNLQYAKKLLETVEQYEYDGNGSSRSQQQRLQELRETANKLEFKLLDTEKRVTPPPVRLPPILPSIPLPAPSARETASETTAQEHDPHGHPPSAEGINTPADATQDLLLSPDEELSLHNQPYPLLSVPTAAPTAGPTTLLPLASASKPSTTSATAAGTPAFLANSQALQEELSEQLARMATQLKHNALHFSTSLEKDKAVVEAAQGKLERNHDVMTKERVRLRDHRSKSWGTTWLVVLSMIVAIVGFVLTFFVIRLT